MGFTPQFVDLDGDGLADIITGSWPGELCIFRRQENGNLAALEHIADSQGQPINPGSASTVFAVDWDGDGDLDLLLGNIQGEVLLSRNDGTRRAPFYQAPEKLHGGGSAISVAGGDSAPTAADWDGDGRLDLIVGCGDGSVLLFRREAGDGQPILAAARPLVAPAGTEIPPDAAEPKPGRRAKPCVADFNGDGLLDLLVGDFAMQQTKPTGDQADTAKALAQARARQAQLAKEFELLVQAPENETADQREARKAKLQSVLEERRALQRQIANLQPQQQYAYHGWVWLYLRRPVP